MADVTYNTASFPSLIRTLQTIIRGGDPDDNKKSPLVLLGYKERDPAERSLWKMAADIGIALERVDERRGAGGNAVEIWLGRARATYVAEDQVSPWLRGSHCHTHPDVAS